MTKERLSKDSDQSLKPDPELSKMGPCVTMLLQMKREEDNAGRVQQENRPPERLTRIFGKNIVLSKIVETLVYLLNSKTSILVKPII